MGTDRTARPRPLIGLIAVLATSVLLIAFGVGWQLSRSGTAPNESSSAIDASVGLTVYPTEDRPPLPSATGTTLDGKPIALAGARGHILVVNVWGSWCAPCREEAPDLVAVAAETADQGVWFVGIDVRDKPAAARAFVRKFGIKYPSLDDQNGKVLAQFSGLIPTSAVPSTLVVDQKGKIAARVVGRVNAETLRQLIDDLLPPLTPALTA